VDIELGADQGDGGETGLGTGEKDLRMSNTLRLHQFTSRFCWCTVEPLL